MPVRSSPPPFVLAAALGLGALGLGPVRPVIADDADAAPLVPPPPPVAALVTSTADEAAAETKPAPRAWHSRLAEGIEESRKVQRPILVRVGAEWCGWCKRLDREIVDPAVQAELAKWVLVEIDVDEAPEDAERLAIGPIPALRVLDASGRTVRSTEGFLPAEELVKWLQGKESGEAGMSDPVAEIPALSEETLPELVRLLGHRDVRVREAVSRSLAADPKGASGAVVAGFIKGTLVTRLTALEILSGWKAPVADLDPWQPRTVTAERLEALEEWAESLPASPAPDPDGDPAATAADKGSPRAAMLTPADLEEARREIAKLEAADPIELEAIGARLAHRGPLLLPEVQAQRERAASPALRERLDWLRYRLVSPDALALKWPAGLFGLASAEASRRQAAAAELKEIVTPGDEALLIELLRHPDPLVRELSLKALGGIEGTRSRQELAKLLSDPDPNVRAAVLKEMAAQPDAALVPEVLAYLEREQDADLIVSAIRMLQEVPTPEARGGLMKLLKHASWQVRAEAVEGITKDLPEGPFMNGGQRSTLVDVYAAVVELLEDEDGFVVSRAVLALKECDMAAAVAPLAKTAERRPELAAAVAEALSNGESIRGGAGEVFRSWLHHSHENLRAVAITRLRALSQLHGEKELLPALSDPHQNVRIAATRALLEELGELRTSAQYREWDTEPDGEAPSPPSVGIGGLLGLFVKVTTTSSPPLPPPAPTPAEADKPPASEADGADESSMETWLTTFRQGTDRPKWMTRALEPLKGQFAAVSAAERVPAGIALTALGEDAPLETLVAIARQDPHLAEPVGEVLGWLPRPARMATFRTLRGVVRDRHEVMRLCHQLGMLPDPGVSELLWEVLREPDTDAALAEVARDRLMSLHGQEFDAYVGPPTESSPFRLAVLSPHLKSGHEWECRAALTMLVQTDPEAVVEAARGMAADTARSDALRTEAFAIVLYALTPREARKEAIAALVAGDRPRLKPALFLLAFEPAAFQQTAIENFPLPESHYMVNGSAPRDLPRVRPPLSAELSPEYLRRLLESGDKVTATLARYVLAMQGERVDLGPLIARWREEGVPFYGAPRWDRLVYEAMAERNDPADVPVLEELYEFVSEQHGGGAVREFYWTIRTMTGPEVLALRKRIRAEVGMEVLQ